MSAEGTGGLPRLTPLGDGTATVAGRRGEIRLSQDRKRWWNGVSWELVADSTPPDAQRDPAGARWWDGEEWRPLAAVRRWYSAPRALQALYAVPLILLVLAFSLGGGIIWALGLLTFVAWIVVVVRSTLVASRSKGLWVVLSVVGMAVDEVLSRRDRRRQDSRMAASASRL